MRKKFITYYGSEVKNQLDNGTALKDVEVDLRLSKITPLHAQWLVEMYCHFTTEKSAMVGRKQAFLIFLLDHILLLQKILSKEFISRNIYLNKNLTDYTCHLN